MITERTSHFDPPRPAPTLLGHRPSFWGHSTYRRGLPRRRGADTPRRLWIGVLRGRKVSGGQPGGGDHRGSACVYINYRASGVRCQKRVDIRANRSEYVCTGREHTAIRDTLSMLRQNQEFEFHGHVQGSVSISHNAARGAASATGSAFVRYARTAARSPPLPLLYRYQYYELVSCFVCPAVVTSILCLSGALL